MVKARRRSPAGEKIPPTSLDLSADFFADDKLKKLVAENFPSYQWFSWPDHTGHFVVGVRNGQHECQLIGGKISPMDFWPN